MKRVVLIAACLILLSAAIQMEAAPVSSLPISSVGSLSRADSLAESSELSESSRPLSSSSSLPLSSSSSLPLSSSSSPPPLPSSSSQASSPAESSGPVSENSEASKPSEESSEESSADFLREKPDPVGKLIDNMVEGKPVNLKSIGIGKGHTIALANKNDIYREGPDEGEDDNRNEENIKKGTEAGQKRHQEDLSKIHMEGRTKKINLQRKKVKTEERAKAFDDELRTTDEQTRKKSREQESKSNEQTAKKIEESDKKREAALDSTKRAETVQKAQMTAAIQQAKAVAELEKKKAQEEIEKANAEAKLKLEEATRKHELEARQKKRKEAAEKRAAEIKAKKKAEEEQKEQKRREEQAEKQKEQQQKEQEQKHKQQVAGTTCHCTNTRVRFDSKNTWINCPGGHLLTGLYRARKHVLSSILYYQCCRPCKDDGRTVLNVGNCVAGQWQRSFDSTGWSNCPGHSFINGFYKSGCDLIYCIEHAHCCNIQGSRGRKNCGAKGSWGLSLDREGWSVLDGHHFMIGLYRSGGHWLYNIEYPNQCTFFANG